jgi:hypothetical protein
VSGEKVLPPQRAIYALYTRDCNFGAALDGESITGLGLRAAACGGVAARLAVTTSPANTRVAATLSDTIAIETRSWPLLITSSRSKPVQICPGACPKGVTQVTGSEARNSLVCPFLRALTLSCPDAA